MYQKLSKYNFLILILFLTLFSNNQKKCHAQSNLWEVGTARVDITPQTSLWLAGYASRDHAAEGTLHKIWAKALALKDQKGNTGVIVTADILGFPKGMSDEIRAQCREKYGLSKAQIILSASHTHTGPVLKNSLYDIYPLNEQRIKAIEDYSDKLSKKIVGLVGKALKNIFPAQLYSGNGVVRFQINRRNNNAATLSAQSDLNGPNDYAVPVLQVKKKGGKLAAFLFGYACHPTVLNFYKWSGDYPGFAQIALEENNPGVNAMFFQGCGADQNPLPRRSVALARQYGQELASTVETVLEEESRPLPSELHTAYSEIDLSFAEPPDLETLKKVAADTTVKYRQKWALHMIDKIEKGQALPKSYPYPVQVWKIGNQPLIVLGGEVVIDYAIELKRIFGQNLFVMAYANDVMSYIPSLRVLREGGYEGAGAATVYGLPAAWQADIENKILGEVIKLSKETSVAMPQTKVLSD